MQDQSLSPMEPQLVGRKRKRTNSSRHRNIYRVLELPTDLTMDIVSRLPATTILRLLSSNYKFNRIVFNPPFNNLFQSYNSMFHRPCTTFLGFNRRGISSYLMEYDPDAITNKMTKSIFAHELDMSCYQYNEKVLISREINSCNGWLLVCSGLKHDADLGGCAVVESLRLLNPITHSCLVFHRKPMLNLSELEESEKKYKYGLGYSSKTGQYKVMRFVKQNQKFYYNSVEIFDTFGGNKHWRVINNFDYSECCVYDSPVVLNDALHWHVTLGSVEAILKFDMDREVFETFYTHNSQDINVDVCSFGLLGGLLYVGTHKWNTDGNSKIWVMKEYGDTTSWTCTLEMPKFPHQTWDLIQVIGNDQLLILSHNKSNLQLYDFKTGSRKALVMRGIDPKLRKRMRLRHFVPNFSSVVTM